MTPTPQRRSAAVLRRDIEALRKKVAELERERARLRRQVTTRNLLIRETEQLNFARWQEPAKLRRVNELRAALKRSRILSRE